MQHLKIPDIHPEMALMAQFKEFFTDFAAVDFARLDDLYDESVMFEDPVHKVTGLTHLRQYFEDLQAGLNKCQFAFENESVGPGKAVFCWQMHYTHPKLKGGGNLSLRGISYIEFGQRVLVHRDYYDMGEMVYEHIPLLGRILLGIKQKLSGSR